MPQVHDPVIHKLGRNPRRPDFRFPAFKHYRRLNATVPLPAVPASFDWSTAVKDGYGMLGNDKYGCCAWAAPEHGIQTWTANLNDEAVPTEAETLAGYASTGFNPATGANDNGTEPSQMYAYWQQTGITCGGKIHKIVAVSDVETTNDLHRREALYFFGGSNVAVNLPVQAQNQTIWDVDNTPGDTTPGSWGGHDIWAVVIFPNGNYGFVTWGMVKQATPAWVSKYCDEWTAAASQDWANAQQKTPAGLDWPTLMADMPELGTAVAKPFSICGSIIKPSMRFLGLRK